MGRPRTEPCGSPAGDSWHRGRGEKPCDACRAAFNEYQRRRYAERKGATVRRWGPVECGTPSGWSAHYRAGSRPCNACREAHRIAQARWRNRRRDRPRLAETIVDVLVTHGRWMTAEVLSALVCDLHPEWKPESVRRKTYQLASEGVLESKKVDRAVYFRALDDAWDLVA